MDPYGFGMIGRLGGVEEESTPKDERSYKVQHTDNIRLRDLLGCCVDFVELDLEKRFLRFWLKDLGPNYLCGYSLEHEQDCCEDVYIADIDGNEDFSGTITIAEERVVENDKLGYQRATFYYFETADGKTMDIRWYGDSNGYYSVAVDFFEILKVSKD